MPATLSQASVSFRTLVPPKAINGEIQIIVTDARGTIAAQETNSYGPFPPNTSNGPFTIPVLNQVDRAQLQPGGSLTLNWVPDPAAGPATDWKFNLTLDLLFSDASNLVVNENGVFLDPANSQVIVGL